MRKPLLRVSCLLAGVLGMVMLAGCPVPVPTAAKVTIAPATATVEATQTISLDASSTDTADTAFTWSSSDEGVAKIQSAKGVKVTLLGVAKGTATITATGAHSGKSGTALVSVPEQPPVVTPPVVIQPALLAPGCNIAIQGVTVPADLRAVVAFTATNTKGQTLAKSELSTVRFILAHLATGPAGSTPKYASYTTTIENPDGVANSGDEATQATYDSAQLNGVTQLADGSFTYRFAKVLPADYPMSAVHEVAAQIARLYVVDGKTYPANPVYKFRPDGVAPGTAGRDIVQTATCNKCHTRLGLHGGQRREIQLCDMCHSPQSTDAQSKNTVDMTAMIHKIHMGEQLPSVEGGTPYQIIGFQQLRERLLESGVPASDHELHGLPRRRDEGGAGRCVPDESDHRGLRFVP